MIFFSLGNFFAFGKKICLYEKVVYGFGVVILLTNALYFLLTLVASTYIFTLDTF